MSEVFCLKRVEFPPMCPNLAFCFEWYRALESCPWNGFHNRNCIIDYFLDVRGRSFSNDGIVYEVQKVSVPTLLQGDGDSDCRDEIEIRCVRSHWEVHSFILLMVKGF
jgi:hypothetical protein